MIALSFRFRWLLGTYTALKSQQMRARTVLAGFVATIVGACNSQETTARPDAPPAVDTMAQPPSWAVPPRYTNLTCSPSVLRPTDVLTMRMAGEHGPTFMAIAPDRTPFVVVFHGEGQPDRGKRKSLVPPDSFARVTELNIDPRQFTAGPWVFGRDTNELLFTKPGFYRLIVGSDLETDGPLYAECLVRYAP